VEVTPGSGAVTASANDGNLPGNTVDNNLSTRWSANGDGQWIKFDLGTARTVTRVRLAVYSGNVRQARFDLQTSTDNVSWFNVITGGLSSGTTTAEQNFDFTDRSARYVRYLGHGNTVNAWNSLSEVSIFATSGPTGPTPTPTSTPVGPTPTPTPTPTNPPTATATPTATPSCTTNCGGGSRILGYFAQWGVYQRAYHVKNIVTSGSASKLTNINYAFGNVVNGQCVIGDTFADYEKAYTAAESVDGVADVWDQPLRGNFNQLRKLKAAYPNIKVLFSFGGWTWSGGFGQAAANPTAFANSCYNVVEDPRWADVFDGIDIEYPNSCGLSCDASGANSYVTLMQALRNRFGSSYLVTAAIPAGYTHINAANYGSAAQYVNWYNVMTYDFFGAFAAQGPTAMHSPLYSWPQIPTANFYTDYAIQLLKSKGIPSNKLLIGYGFYGRGWSGVTQSTPGGSATGPGPGTYEAGIEDYKVLVGRCPSNGTAAGTAYAFCGNQWWSYDTPSTIASKNSYKKSQGLGGAFIWDLSGDTANGALMSAVYNTR